MTTHDTVCAQIEADYPHRSFFSLAELSQMFGCHRTTVERKIKAHGIKTVVVPGGVRVPKSEVFKMLDYSL